ncbi:MAG: hypothetical protein RLZZ519_1873 [Bacteroidota bacterium]|jgi:hypothetical protein
MADESGFVDNQSLQFRVGCFVLQHEIDRSLGIKVLVLGNEVQFKHCFCPISHEFWWDFGFWLTFGIDVALSGCIVGGAPQNIVCPGFLEISMIYACSL